MLEKESEKVMILLIWKGEENDKKEGARIESDGFCLII